MGIAEWALAAIVVIAVIFVILRPDLWWRRDSRSRDGTAVGAGTADGRRRDDDDDFDSDGDGDGGGD